MKGLNFNKQYSSYSCFTMANGWDKSDHSDHLWWYLVLFLGLFSTSSAIALYAIPMQVTQKLAVLPVAWLKLCLTDPWLLTKGSRHISKDLIAVAPCNDFLLRLQPCSICGGQHFDNDILILAALLFVAVIFTGLKFQLPFLRVQGGHANLPIWFNGNVALVEYNGLSHLQVRCDRNRGCF